MKMIVRTMRGRLLLWLAFLLACLLTGFGLTAYQLHRTNRLNQIDEELERRLAILSADFRGRAGPGPPGGPRFEDEAGGPLPNFPPTPGSPPEPPARKPELLPQTLSWFSAGDASPFYFVIWSDRGEPLNISTNAPASSSLPEREDGDTRTHARTIGALREAYHFTERDDCLLVGRSIIPDLQAVHRFAWWLVVCGGGVLGLGLLGGWMIANRALRPVNEISAAAARISVGKLSERINLADTDSELGRLAVVLNSTFARLEAAFAEQKQFTADASHELRTPLAVIISEAQTALARQRNAAEYRETVAACLETAQQMRRLTESLLKLARFDAGEQQSPRTRISLAQSAALCVQRLAPLAAQAGNQLQCDFGPAETFANSDRLGQVIANLLTNAIQYNKPDGEIRVTTTTENGVAILTVADTGIGIAAGDLPHIFERFYRADKARVRANGRTGLGLAICKAILNADGGSIEVTSRPGVGSTFTVRLPLVSE